MNICGCLVHIAPGHRATASAAMAAAEGVEVHGSDGDGRFVVVVEDTDRRRASETIMDLHQIPGVISVTLTYHHFEDAPDAGTSPTPQDRSEAGGQHHDHI